MSSGIQSKYQLDTNLKDNLENIYTISGNKSEVIPIIHIIKQQPIANVVLGTALAAPLVYILKCSNIAVHIYGLNGSGKSTVNKFVFSLFGNPLARNAMPTIDTTKVGLEFHFGGRRDLPTFLEDISSIDDFKTQQIVKKLPYQFVNGEGRLRGTTSGTNQNIVEFRGSLITSSEKSLTTDTSEGGSKRRVIELQAPNILFDLDTIELIQNTFKDNYGLWGTEWIETVKQNTKTIELLYNDIKHQLIHKYPNKVPNHILGLAVIITANIIFSKFCLNECDELLEIKHITEIIDSLPDNNSISEYIRAKSLIMEWIASHPKNFAENPNNITGYEWWGVKRFNYTAVLPTYLKQLLTDNNMNPSVVLKQLADDGFIQRGSEQIQKKIKIHGQQIKMYCINAETEENMDE